MPSPPSAQADARGAAWSALVLLAALACLQPGCQPRVAVEAPKKPITINLNINLDAQVRVKLEEQAEKDIKSNPDVF